MSQFGTEQTDTDPAVSAEEPRTMSLLGGVVASDDSADGDELAATTDGGGILGQTTVLLLLVTLIAAGALYGMRLTQGDISGNVSADVETRIDQVLAKLANPGKSDANPLAEETLQTLFRDTDAIVAMFADDPTRQQVPIEYVKKNPFANPLVEKKQAEAKKPNPSHAEREAEMRRRQLQSELSSYKLQTVMQGRTPVAIINGQLIQAGQELGSFTVGTIDSMRVELIADDTVYTLEMESGASGGSRPRRR